MQAGETNVQVQLNAGGYDLTGTTCQLITLAPGALDPATARQVLSLLVSVDGTYAYRNTAASDFPTPGIYRLQLHVTKPDGTLLLSPEQMIEIGVAL